MAQHATTLPGTVNNASAAARGRPVDVVVVEALRRSAGTTRQWMWTSGGRIEIVETGDQLYS